MTRHRFTWFMIVCLLAAPACRAQSADAEYTVTVTTPVNAPAGVKAHWMQVRAGTIPPGAPGAPGDTPRIVITMQLQNNTGTHMFNGMADLITDDLGRTWQGPTVRDTIDVHRHASGLLEAPVDGTPKWHAATGRLLVTGATFWLDPVKNRDIPGGDSDTFYSVYDAVADTWSRWDTLKMPDDPRFDYARAGGAQRVDLPNGDILLPIYFGEHNNSIHYATVARCRFDGEKLTYIEHGDELVVDHGRGFSEPSLTELGGRYYLTLRNDKANYVTAGDDGMHFDEPILWKFDDGEPLGSYNTQQHWVTHAGKLYLVYTRRGLDNDHVFRHRAPLVMARVDPATLRVIRATERVILPMVGNSSFGNFGVRDVTPHETWVTAGRHGAKPGEPSVYIGRIHWSP